MTTLLAATMGLAALLGVWGGAPQDNAWDAWDGEAHLLAAERATGAIADAPVEYLGLRVTCERVIFEAVDPGNGDHADAAWDESIGSWRRTLGRSAFGAPGRRRPST